MLDPLPPILKVFTLVVKKNINILLRMVYHLCLILQQLGILVLLPLLLQLLEMVSLNVRGPFVHTGTQSHTVDKCYKLHGYPPDYKFRSKAKETPQVNQAISTDPIASPESPLSSLTASQCHQLIAFLSSQLHTSSLATIEPLQPQPSLSSIHRNHVLLSNSPLNSLPNIAQSQTLVPLIMCCFIELFLSSVQVSNSFVTLPNDQSVSIYRISFVRIFNALILTNVLFVPQFRFNLLSINSLSQSHNCSVNFLADSCVIQDHTQGMMIGKGRRRGNLYVMESTSFVPFLFDIIASCNNFVCLKLNCGIIDWDILQM